LSGLGVCHAPSWLLPDELGSGAVIKLLPEWQGRPFPIHAIFPSHRQHVAKIEAFVSDIAA
jgi:DNA-binding transcriptional LysR family regulator